MVVMKSKIKVNIGKTKEFLSYDILEEDYIKVFEPYRLVQKVLGSCRVDIKYRFITAPSILQKCYTILCIILVIFGTVPLMQRFWDRPHISRVMNYVWVGGLSGLISVFVISMFHARFCNNEGNVQLHIKMHEINHVMKLNKNKINSVLYRFNLVTSIALVAALVMLIIMSFIITRVNYTIYEIAFPAGALISFLFELSYITNCMTFFIMRVRLINSMISNHLRKENSVTINIQTKQGRPLKTYDKIALEWQNFNSSRPDIHLKEIFRGYTSFQDLCSFQVLLFVGSSVSWVFVTIEYGLLAFQKNMELRLITTDFMQLGTVAVLKVCLLLALCVNAEVFSRTVKKTKKLSIKVVSRYTEGPLMVKAKKMTKLIEESPPNFSVYGMLNLDARFLLIMFHITTSWLVTLLQFTFL